MHANRQLMEILARSGTFQNYQRACMESTGLPIALRPVESWQLPFHGNKNENVRNCSYPAESRKAPSASSKPE